MTASTALTMIIFAVLFFALQKGLIWAKVVDDFNECRQFFYMETEPQGMDQNAKKICQKYGEEWEHGEFYYASLYSKVYRIPVYSAYIFDPGCRNQAGQKSSDWFIEPMLSDFTENGMMPQSNYNKDQLQLAQAVNGDYSNTGYDRGHLNPNSFQCQNGRTATFTLTNAAPMDACFNRVHWKKWEDAVKAILKNLPEHEGTAYLVTGTVVDRSQNYRIPRRGEFDDPGTREFDRVAVPNFIWTAVCYEHNTESEKSFSFGYIGLNQPDSRINVKTVQELSNQLSGLYGQTTVQIFHNDCFSANEKSEEIVKKLYKKIQLPISDRLVMSEGILNTFHTAMSQFDDAQPKKRAKIENVKIMETFNSPETWFKNTERMKYVSGSSCVLFNSLGVSEWELTKRDTKDDNSEEVVCSLIAEEVSGCTSSCLYNEKARGYNCYSYSYEERSCSPVYSMITVSGATCRSDHTCGTHGYDYYWCNKDSSWDYCSPPLPLGKGLQGKPCRYDYNCGKYGYKYTWCYTDYSNNWDYCCSIGDDPYSALNGKTCKDDSPCNYYSKSYLWCCTTDGSWEYCCTPSQ